MIINKRYTFPRHFLVNLMQSETLTRYLKVFSMAFVGEIGRNGVLYSGTSDMAKNQYIGNSIAINQIEKKGYQ